MPGLMQDHPGWTSTPDGAARVMRSGPDVWLLLARPTELGVVDASPIGVATEPAPRIDVFEPSPVGGVFGELGVTLTAAGPVARVGNADLWDAIATAIIRQVIAAGQARAMYQRFSATHGEAVAGPHGDLYLVPSAERVTELPDEAFDLLGMKFKRPALRAAAAAFLDQGDAWAQLTPAKLAEALLGVFRIGPWTAGAAVADWSNDFALYPFDDMAVRHWARIAAPGIEWPDTDRAFGALWSATAQSHLSVLTLLTLAWGDSHVRDTT